MMAGKHFLLGCALLGFSVLAQTPIGEADDHPKITTYRCTTADGCKEATNYLVLDSASHGIYQAASGASCGDWGNGPDPTACPSEEECAKNCVMNRVQDYSSIGVTTKDDELLMEQIVDGRVVSPRIYLLNEAKDKYEMLKLTGQELSFDIDSTHLPCGMNSALYMGEMLDDGGKSDLNPGGATWGTGYCDAQCYVTPFINGVVSDLVLPLNPHTMRLTLSLRAMLVKRALAATRWTSGRPMLDQRKLLLTPATRLARTYVLEMNARRKVFATRTAAVGTHTDSTSPSIMEKVQTSPLTRRSHLLS